LLGNIKRLRPVHELLPGSVDSLPRLDGSTPLLCPRYQASSLLRVDPPPCPASVLCPSWVFHLGASLCIGATGSHVPHRSLNQDHAASMPATIWAVSRFPPNFVPGQGNRPGFDDIHPVSTLHRRFTCVRLPGSHLTDSAGLPFPGTLTTAGSLPVQLLAV
jgi:hypothetical protein